MKLKSKPVVDREGEAEETEPFGSKDLDYKIAEAAGRRNLARARRYPTGVIRTVEARIAETVDNKDQ